MLGMWGAIGDQVGGRMRKENTETSEDCVQAAAVPMKTAAENSLSSPNAPLFLQTSRS